MEEVGDRHQKTEQRRDFGPGGWGQRRHFRSSIHVHSTKECTREREREGGEGKRGSTQERKESRRIDFFFFLTRPNYYRFEGKKIQFNNK